MNDETLNPNFEWRKKSFGKKERLSRRIDTNQAALSETKKKNNFSQALPITAPNAAFDNNLKKMRKKIKRALDDEEEDEEENDIFTDISNPLSLDNAMNENPLFYALSDNEKQLLKQKQTLRDINMQQKAAKITALATVNAFAKKAGLPKISPQDMAEHMQNNGWGKETFRSAIEHSVAPDIKVGTAKLNPEKIKKLMAGLKRLQKLGGFYAVQGMKMNDIIHITNTRHDDKKVAQLLLKKTGRKATISADKKRARLYHQQKVSFRKLLQQKQSQQQQSATKV